MISFFFYELLSIISYCHDILDGDVTVTDVESDISGINWLLGNPRLTPIIAQHKDDIIGYLQPIRVKSLKLPIIFEYIKFNIK